MFNSVKQFQFNTESEFLKNRNIKQTKKLENKKTKVNFHKCYCVQQTKQNKDLLLNNSQRIF